MTKIRGKTWLTLSLLGESAQNNFFLLLSSQSTPPLTCCLQHKPNTTPLGSCPHTDHAYGMDPICTPFKYTANTYSPDWAASTWRSHYECSFPCIRNTRLLQALGTQEPSMCWGSTQQTERPLHYLQCCSLQQPLCCFMAQGLRCRGPEEDSRLRHRATARANPPPGPSRQRA